MGVAFYCIFTVRAILYYLRSHVPVSRLFAGLLWRGPPKGAYERGFLLYLATKLLAFVHAGNQPGD